MMLRRQTTACPQAKAAALRALEIDDSLAEAHTALGFCLFNYEWDRDGSEKEYRRAIELKPNYATAHHCLGSGLSNVKRFDDSLIELRLAEELDPLSPIIGANLSDTLAWATCRPNRRRARQPRSINVLTFSRLAAFCSRR
jgi:Tfp pilus assembly protein PilF